MDKDTKTQGTITVFQQSTHIETWVQAFLTDRKTQNLSKGTLRYYQKTLKVFCSWCEAQALTQFTQLTPDNLRTFLLWLEERGHNPGGIHAIYRAVRCFIRWWVEEVEPENFKDPTKKVKAPKVALEVLEPADRDVIDSLLSTCTRGELLGERDRAIFYALQDTGARASELLGMDLEDLDQVNGAVLIRYGKGKKPRMVYLGKTSRKAVRRYLSLRKDTSPALWVTSSGERLTYDGLRSMVKRRAAAANVKDPTLHSFRRLFAITMLRNGTDVFSLQKLMGHADLQILRRYLAQNDTDTREAHRRAGPVDGEGN